MSDQKEVVHQIIARVAESEGCDPTDLPPLYEYIDTDALLTLVNSCKSVRVEFTYVQHSVAVEQGLVDIQPVTDKK